jgi:hypothetical protein
MKKYQQEKTAISHKVKEVVYILDSDKRIVYTLNTVASKIWNYLKKPKSIDESVLYVQSIYNVRKKVARDDILEFIAKYQKRGLIKEILDK